MKVLFLIALICVTALSEDQPEEAPDLYTKIQKAFGQLQTNFDGADTKVLLEKLQAVLADSVQKLEPEFEDLKEQMQEKAAEEEQKVEQAENAAEEKLAEEKVEIEKTAEQSKQELEDKLEKVVKEMKAGDWKEWAPEGLDSEQDEQAAPVEPVSEQVAFVAAKPNENVPLQKELLWTFAPIAFVLFLFAFGVSVLSFAVYYLFNQKEEARWANVGGYTSFNNTETHSLMEHGHFQKSGYYQQDDYMAA